MGWLAIIILLLAIAIAYVFLRSPVLQPVDMTPRWWGPGETPRDDDVTVNRTTINIKDDDIDDLKRRLQATRFGSDLENGTFEYGFQTEFMKTVRKHWLDEFDWKKQESLLNKYAHFTTNIEGINVHFLRAFPKIAVPVVQNSGNRVILLIHGWPGSFWEFTRVLPLLTDPQTGEIGFEVICPSLPGYGFSDAPRKKGFGIPDGARILLELMRRLGHKQFYVQGGDIGAMIGTVMAQIYPGHILGLHVNVPVAPRSMMSYNLHNMAAMALPSVFLREADRGIMRSFWAHWTFLMQETGHMHIQATKPDTMALGLMDSPIGLAAYILEKFSTWTNPDFRLRPDGGLTSSYALDDLLSNVAIYWFTGTIGSSMRWYKMVFGDERYDQLDSYPVNVPCAIANFPHELTPVPRALAGYRYKKILQYTNMPTGGHFAALEQPELLADDIYSFVRKVEALEELGD